MSEQIRSVEEAERRFHERNAKARWHDKANGVLWEDRPHDGPAVGMASREKTAHEVLDEMIDLLRRRADQLDRLKGSLPPELNHHASKALCGLVREAMRNI